MAYRRRRSRLHRLDILQRLSIADLLRSVQDDGVAILELAKNFDAAGSFASSATQSPRKICGFTCGDGGEDCGIAETKRGVLLDAPPRGMTMTQDSDSGNAVGDAGPTTDRFGS